MAGFAKAGRGWLVMTSWMQSAARNDSNTQHNKGHLTMPQHDAIMNHVVLHACDL